MPCSSTATTEAQRLAREAAFKKLDADIAAGRAQIIRTADGRVGVARWAATDAARTGWCDGCVLRALQQRGSWATRQKLAAAGVVEGRGFIALAHGHGHGHGDDHDH